jgi:RHS repeat-associated protein
VGYSYNNAGQATAVWDSQNSYVAQANYAPQGASGSATLGWVNGGFGGIAASYGYNQRLQMSSKQVSSNNGTVLNLSYDYGAANNGTVRTIRVTDNLQNTDRSQTYTYDALNRIRTASSSANAGANCWGQSFRYDSVYPTNLSSVTASKCTAQTFSHSITNKNRIAGFTYDNASNVTNDGNLTYTWNALNQMTTAGGATYTYDGDGQRVSNGSKLYWYSVDGSVLAETDLSGNLIREFIYFNGERVARREGNGTVYYFFSDHLGTARVMTNATGVTQQESTYYPFGGEQRQIVSTVDNRYKFTGMERDGQTGLDHTQYREYSSTLARWLSPDPICANCYDPQNLNRYSYVRNDPVNLIDPYGAYCVYLDGGGVGDDGMPPPCPDPSVWTDYEVGVTATMDLTALVDAEFPNIPPWVNPPTPPSSTPQPPGGGGGGGVGGSSGASPSSPKATNKNNCVPRAAIITEAAKWENTRYSHAQPAQCKIGGDCSGTVRAIYRNVGISIALGQMSGSAALGIYNSPSLSRTSTGRIGDITYWSTPYHHVAIFAGNGSVWSARSTKSGKPFGKYPMKDFGYGNPPTYLSSPQVCE